MASCWREERLVGGSGSTSTADAVIFGGSSSTSTADAVIENRSVVAVPEFASAEECASLIKEANLAEDAGLQNALTSDATRKRLEIFGRQLQHKTIPSMSDTAKAIAERFVRRAIAFVQTELPELANGLGLCSCTADTKLRYSEGEPAVNIYYGPGGTFQPHMDMQSLTVLLALTTASDDYEGGGTSFYAPEAELPAARRGKVSPIALLRPPAGTALLWSGTLLHAGAEVTAGRRLVFVASFTPCETNGSASESDGAATTITMLDKDALSLLGERLQATTVPGLTDAGAIAIAGALSTAEAKHLHGLCLGSNPIGDAGCAAIAAALMTPPLAKLAVLQLGDTDIGDAGAASLSRAFEGGAMKARGRQLWVAATRMSETGKAALMQACVQHVPKLRVCW